MWGQGWPSESGRYSSGGLIVLDRPTDGRASNAKTGYSSFALLEMHRFGTRHHDYFSVLVAQRTRHLQAQPWREGHSLKLYVWKMVRR